MTIYKYYPGYQQAIRDVAKQTLEEDLSMIDALYGRDKLRYGATPSEVKVETLRQLEIEYRESVNEDATFWVNVARSTMH